MKKLIIVMLVLGLVGGALPVDAKSIKSIIRGKANVQLQVEATPTPSVSPTVTPSPSVSPSVAPSPAAPAASAVILAVKNPRAACQVSAKDAYISAKKNTRETYLTAKNTKDKAVRKQAKKNYREAMNAAKASFKKAKNSCKAIKRSAVSTASPSPSVSPSVSPSPTITPTPSPTATPSPTPTPMSVTKPVVIVPSCTDINYTAGISWTGASASFGYFVDISKETSFTAFWNKLVGSGTSTVAPSGFSLHGGSPASLILEPGIKYFTRIYNGLHSQTTEFQVNTCPTPTPSPTPSI